MDSSIEREVRMMTRATAERFWEKVDFGVDCWKWDAYCDPEGYGRFMLGSRNVYSHRFAYEFCVGIIPRNKQIDHLCRVRHCVNPDHLEVVTQRENILRGKGITAQAAKAANCPHGHEYNAENTIIRNQGWRQCRTCKRASDAKRRVLV